MVPAVKLRESAFQTQVSEHRLQQLNIENAADAHNICHVNQRWLTNDLL